jgi:hypothetical protein
VKQVTLLSGSPFIVVAYPRREVHRMLLLSAIAHLMPVRAQQPDQGPSNFNAVLGHLGLTIIALVYVLVVMWQN